LADILEYQRIIEGQNDLTIIPDGEKNKFLTQLLAADSGEESKKDKI